MQRSMFPMVVLALGSLMATAVRADEKISLKINLPKGTNYKMTTGMDMTTKLNVGGQSLEVPMKMGMDMAIAVDDVDSAGVQTLKTTYSGIRMKMGGLANIEYDSSKPDDGANPLGKVMGAMIGQPLTVKIGADGKVKSVDGVEEMMKKLGEAMQGLPGADKFGKNQVDQMKGQFDQMSAWLPKEPVAVGDSWDIKMDMSADPNMPMQIEGKCKLVDRKGGIAQIDVDGKVTGQGGLTGSMKGKVGVNEKTGWTMSTDMDMKLAGKVQGQDIELDGKVTQSTTEK